LDKILKLQVHGAFFTTIEEKAGFTFFHNGRMIENLCNISQWAELKREISFAIFFTIN